MHLHEHLVGPRLEGCWYGRTVRVSAKALSEQASVRGCLVGRSIRVVGRSVTGREGFEEARRHVCLFVCLRVCLRVCACVRGKASGSLQGSWREGEKGGRRLCKAGRKHHQTSGQAEWIRRPSSAGRSRTASPGERQTDRQTDRQRQRQRESPGRSRAASPVKSTIPGRNTHRTTQGPSRVFIPHA